MIRTVIGFLGVLTALFPNRAVDVFETVAIANPDECTTRPWIGSGVRAEGVVIAGASLTGGRPYAWLMNLTGVFGAVVLLIPEAYRKFATTLLYEHPEEVEWNTRFTDAVRILGALYVLLGLRELEKRRAAD